MLRIFDRLGKDFRFALRQLWTRPGFTITAVLVLALGLGANAAIFSVVNAVLLEPLPFTHPESLMGLFERDPIPNDPYNNVAVANYLDWRHDTTTFAQIAASKEVTFNLSSKGNGFTPQRIFGATCSANLFATLGVSPVLGRTFREAEDKPGAPPVAIISYGLWKQRFAGSKDVLHRRIRLDDVEYNIVGVMPENLRYPTRRAEVWVTLERYLPADTLASHDNHQVQVVGRLRPGVTEGQGRAEIDGFVQRFRKTHPAVLIGRGATVVRLDQSLVRNVQDPLWILLGAVGCLLVIACVNIANLLLTRALGRQREMAIRAAVGATRAQIMRQLLIESITISLAGAFTGLILASWGAPLLAAHAPGGEALPQTANIQVNYTVLLFTIGLAVVTGIVAGLFPAFSASQTDLVNGLKEGSRSNTASRAHAGTRHVLIAVEVAISVMLLIGAGLLIHSFARLQNVHTGFRTENTITMGVTLPDATYKDRAAVASFSRELSGRIETIHGVESSGLVSVPPLSGSITDSAYHIEGHPLPAGQLMDLTTRSASPGYFKAAGISLLAGRLFTLRDTRGYNDAHPNVDPALISQSGVDKFFHGIDPIGRYLDRGSDIGPITAPPGHPYPRLQIIGIVSDILVDPATPVQPTVYMPLQDGDARDLYVVAHTTRNPESAISALQNAIHSLDPDLPIHDIRTVDQIAAESTADRQFSLVLLTLFAALAVVLAAVGLYGVLSYGVSQRVSEIGIRMALGATGVGISRSILLQGMKPAIVGIIAGLIGAAFLTSTLKAMLFGVDRIDPATFVAVPVVLLMIVILACTIPAYRASRIDPITALRTE